MKNYIISGIGALIGGYLALKIYKMVDVHK